MIRLLIKLAIAALVVNAAVRVGSAYTSFYRFKDSVSETVQYGHLKSDEALRQRVGELARTYDVPLTGEDITVERRNSHTLVTGSYKKAIEVVPGYRYEWPFTLDIDIFTLDELPGAQ
jgi:hypothetical protein